MTREQVTKVMKMYGYAVVRIHEVQKGYRNEAYAVEVKIGKTLNLILYKNEPGIRQRIQNANCVADSLAAKGFLSRATADPRIVCLKGSRAIRYASLYNYLPGTTIPWEAYTMSHIKEVGATMGSMHGVLKTLPRGNLPAITEELTDINLRMQNYFAQENVQMAAGSKLRLNVPLYFNRYTKLFSAVSGLAGAQALHMDFVRGNILFLEGKSEISGILDFEKTAWGLPVFDIARTLAFLLIDCKYKDSAKVRKYFLQSGYNKRGGNHIASDRLLEELLDFFLLYDFYKFLRHNPYESLEQNEHFTRTRDFLLARNVISAGLMVK
jgi:Ser/Thr protein kinase RdoA (MazF antagonist)